MIGHIFKKDLRLLWPFAAGLAVLGFIHAGFVLKLGIFAEPRSLEMLNGVFGLACSLAASLVIVIAVHQDALVGTRQDVLTRPVARLDLLLAKLLFVLLAIQGPIVLAGLTVGLVHDMSFGTALAAALGHAAWAMVDILPVVMVAALTGTLLEAIIGLFLLALCAYLPWLLNSLQERSTFLFSQLSTLWVSTTLQSLIVLAGAAFILPLQYLKRRTWLLRAALAAIALVNVAVSQLPWTTGFAVTAAASPNRAFADRVAIAFDPDGGRFRSPGGEASPGDPYFFLPMRVFGLPQNSMLDTDRVVITVRDTAGHILFHGAPVRYDFFHQTNMDGNASLALRLGAPAQGTVRLHEAFNLPRDVFDRIKQQKVRIGIDYYFALFQRGASAALPATGGRRIIPGIGSCAWRLGAREDPRAGDVWCYPTTDRRSCFVHFIRDRKSGLRNRDEDLCIPSFEPKFLQLAALDRPGEELIAYDFREDFGRPNQVHLTQAGEADVVVIGYVPQAFFTRHTETPPLRLTDWGIVIVPHMQRKTLG